MSLPDILGPVNTTESFMIVSIQDKLPNLLLGTGPTGSITYYWEDNINNISGSKKVGIFNSFGTESKSLTIQDNINSGGLGFNFGSNSLINVAQPSPIEFEQSVYANWWAPNVLLSRAVYNLKTGKGETATIPDSKGNEVLANNIIILPVNWYFHCEADGTYDFINQPTGSVFNWFCLVDTKTTGCSGTTIVDAGWTNLNDCSNGLFYTYCPVNKGCGDKNCNGPCSQIYYDCDDNSGNFSCVFNPDEYFEDTEWWTSPWFITSAIILSLVLIFLIIWIIRLATSNADQ